MSLKHSLAKLRHGTEPIIDRQALMLGKHKLLAEINRRQEERRISRPSFGERVNLVSLRMVRRIIPRREFVIAFLLVILVTTSTGFMAQAAIPGDILWPVKLSFEKAELAFAVDSAQEGRLHIKHVENRIKELGVMLAEPAQKNKNQNISQLVRRLEKDITAADQSLKITNDEKKDSQPQIVAALAKDLSDRATEAVRALEENKKVLEVSQVPSVSEQDEQIANGTSTDSLTNPDENQSGSSNNASSSDTAISEQGTSLPERDLSDVITEVQIVNEYISYNALQALIDLVERRSGANRSEVTGVLRQRISEQRQQFDSIQDAVPLINENFLLHRIQLKIYVKKVDELLTQAENDVVLDNLSGSLKKLTEAKDNISKAAALLQEVRRGNGLKPKDSLLMKPVVQPIQVLVQSLSTASSTTASSTEH